MYIIGKTLYIAFQIIRALLMWWPTMWTASATPATTAPPSPPRPSAAPACPTTPTCPRSTPPPPCPRPLCRWPTPPQTWPYLIWTRKRTSQRGKKWKRKRYRLLIVILWGSTVQPNPKILFPQEKKKKGKDKKRNASGTKGLGEELSEGGTLASSEGEEEGATGKRDCLNQTNHPILFVADTALHTQIRYRIR